MAQKNFSQAKPKNATRDDLESRNWGICSDDEKTLNKIFELFCSLGLTGPLHQVPCYHAIFRYHSKPRYAVPYAVIDHLVENRTKEGYEFFAFSKALRQQFALYREGKGMHATAMQKVFDGTSVARNKRTGILSNNVNAYQTRRVA